MRLLIGIFLIHSVLIVSPCFSKDGFEHFGFWENVIVSESADPHAMGYELTLFKNKGDITGLLAKFVGPPHDPPRGWVKNCKYEPGSGKITFNSTLKTGTRYSKEKKEWIPAIDTYKFSGQFKSGRLIGSFKIELEGEEGTVVQKEKVKLKGKFSDGKYPEKRTYEEWREFYAPIIKDPMVQ